MDILSKLKTDLSFIKDKHKILVSVSGGPDSMVLLHLLLPIYKNISVFHLNHNLRKEAKDEYDFVKNFCKKNNIIFFGYNKDIKKIAKKYKESIETTARKIRYETIEKLVKKHTIDYVFTGHHKDDLVETILLNLIRGTSITGISSMQFQKGKYIKPLIYYEKKEIVIFAKKNNINYQIDKSNFEKKYDRNKIRLDILPKIEKFNKDYKKNLISFYKNCIDIDIFLEKFLKNNINKFLNKGILQTNFIKYDSFLQKEFIKRVIRKIKGDIWGITKNNLKEICNFFINSNSGSIYKIWNINFINQNGKIIFIDKFKESLITKKTNLKDCKCIKFKISNTNFTNQKEVDNFIQQNINQNYLVLDITNIDTNKLYLNQLNKDLKFKSLGSKKYLNIKRYLINKKYPFVYRNLLIGLYKDKEILSILPIEINEDYKIDKNTKKVLIIKYII